MQVSLGTLECEIFTISPIHVSYKLSHQEKLVVVSLYLMQLLYEQAVNKMLDFAPIGLIDMFNSGGATEGLSVVREPSGCSVRIEARGCGRFGAYSSEKPARCTVDGDEVDFEYNVDNGLLIVKLEGECIIRTITICY